MFTFLATDVVCCTASIYLVLVISIDRYVGVSHIHRKGHLTKKIIFSFMNLYDIYTGANVCIFLPDATGDHISNSRFLCKNF